MPTKRILSSLNEGESCNIIEVLPTGAMVNRLKELGFTCGARVECLRRSFSGDPTAYLIKGTVIALRKNDAEGIIVGQKKCGWSDPAAFFRTCARKERRAAYPMNTVLIVL